MLGQNKLYRTIRIIYNTYYIIDEIRQLSTSDLCASHGTPNLSNQIMPL